jgi:hypothetical protein
MTKATRVPSTPRTTALKIVAGTDHTPTQTEPRRDLMASGRICFRACDDQPLGENLTSMNRNKRPREQRKGVWSKASATTRYCRAQREFELAICKGRWRMTG